MRIQTKLLVFFLPLLLTSVGLIAYLARQAVHAIVAQEVVKRGVSIATSAAENPQLRQGLASADEAQLLPRLQTLLDNTETLYAIVLDQNGRVLAHTNVAEKGKVYADSVTIAALSSNQPGAQRIKIDGSPVLDVSLPVWQIAGTEGTDESFLLLGEEAASQRVRAGTLRLGLPLSDALATADRIALQVFWIIVLVSALGLVLSLMFSRRILTPIQVLARATERLGRGALGETVPVMSKDELGDLAKSFNQMSRELADTTVSKELLNRARDQLEVRVKERTAELNGINESLKREIAERKVLEDQLRQSQKMEAVGRLAGGVAHDFNNQLGVIQGYVDMVMGRLPQDSRLYNSLNQIRKAVQRSVGLTDQLLIFSRKKPVDIQPMDLNRHLADLQKMLSRLLSAEIAVQLKLAPNLWFVKADAGNIDQVVTNLCVNARDAMPDGGTLAIETRNAIIDPAYCQQVPEARPGQFVRLCISDTGTGMDEGVRKQIFEPFFTTKGPGGGTGLGLSVVYGIVQTHEGWITVTSRVGQGTRFDIYLPAAHQNIEFTSVEDNIPPNQVWQRGQGEHILLIEDETGLREVMKEALSDAGYHVIACTGLAEARAAMAQPQQIDLVLSDVVLPDGRGTDLVFALKQSQPELPVLLVTGYADSQSDWDRIQASGLVLLQKPVPVPLLLEHVRKAIDKT